MHLKRVGLLVIIVVVSLYSLITCSENTKQDLRITQITVPSEFPGLILTDQFNDVGIIYSKDYKLAQIELTFDQSLMDQKDYELYMFQGGNYIDIKHADLANKYSFAYKIENNKLTIFGEGMIPFGLVTISIPADLTSVDGSKLGYDTIMRFSPNSFTPYQLLEWTSMDSQGNPSSLVVPSSIGDMKRVGYVNSDNVGLFLNDAAVGAAMNLRQGENVSIVGEDENTYKVQVFYPNGTQPSSMDIRTDIFNKAYCTVKEGFVLKNCIDEIPEPLNKGSYYSIYKTDSMVSEEVEPKVVITVTPPLVGGESELYEVQKIDPRHFYELESVSIWYWSQTLAGKKYFTTYMDQNGNELSQLSRETHLPQIDWSQDEYDKYSNAQTMYEEFVIDSIKQFKILEKYSSFKEELIGSTKSFIKLQEIWIDWGFKNQIRDKNWFFSTVLDNLNLDDNGKTILTDTLNLQAGSSESEALSNKVMFLINAINSPEIDKAIQGVRSELQALNSTQFDEKQK